MNLENLCGLGDEVAENMLIRRGMIERGEELRRVVSKMHEEAKLGSAISQHFQVVVGKRKI